MKTTTIARPQNYMRTGNRNNRLSTNTKVATRPQMYNINAIQKERANIAVHILEALCIICGLFLQIAFTVLTSFLNLSWEIFGVIALFIIPAIIFFAIFYCFEYIKCQITHYDSEQ